jgi:hypothetical protein
VSQPIYQFYDTAFECPECGRRLEFADPVDHDEDGPIYEGECSTHGMFLVQTALEDTEADDDEQDAIGVPTVHGQ